MQLHDLLDNAYSLADKTRARRFVRLEAFVKYYVSTLFARDFLFLSEMQADLCVSHLKYASVCLTMTGCKL